MDQQPLAAVLPCGVRKNKSSLFCTWQCLIYLKTAVMSSLHPFISCFSKAKHLQFLLPSLRWHGIRFPHSSAHTLCTSSSWSMFLLKGAGQSRTQDSHGVWTVQSKVTWLNRFPCPSEGRLREGPGSGWLSHCCVPSAQHRGQHKQVFRRHLLLFAVCSIRH